MTMRGTCYLELAAQMSSIDYWCRLEVFCCVFGNSLTNEIVLLKINYKRVSERVCIVYVTNK